MAISSSDRLLIFSAILFLVAPLCLAKTTLYTGEALNGGEYLTYGPYKLIMQYDCDLVLYEAEELIWHSNTYHFAKDCYLTLKNNGNLEMYSGDRLLWVSNGYGPVGNYVLVLETDGELSVYGPVMWATNTNIMSSPFHATLNGTSDASAAAAARPKNTAGILAMTMSK